MPLRFLAGLVVLSSCCLQPAGDGSKPDSGLVDAGAPDSGHIPIPNPCFILSPRTVDFGNVAVYTTATELIAVTNDCGIDVTIEIGLMKGTDTLLFLVIPNAGSTIVLKNGETHTVMAQYTPLVASPTPNQAYFAIQVCS